LLEKAKAGGYFDEKRIAHIELDSDFNRIRYYPKFAAFIAGLEGKSRRMSVATSASRGELM
jgi:hypothetical protein